MRFGQIGEVALSALIEALAPEPARANRDLRLGDVVSVSERVALGIEKHEHALLLVIVEPEEKRDRSQHGRRCAGAKKPRQRQSRQEHQNKAAEADCQRGAQIGLQQYQQHRGGDQRAGRDQRPPGRHHADWQRRIEPRQNEHDNRLHQFRRLEHERPEIDPALATAADGADRLHSDEQQQHHRVSGIGHELDEIPPQPRRQQGKHEKHRELDEVRCRIGLPTAAAGRVQYKRPKAHQRNQRKQHPPWLARDRDRDDAHCAAGSEAPGAGAACAGFEAAGGAASVTAGAAADTGTRLSASTRAKPS